MDTYDETLIARVTPILESELTSELETEYQAVLRLMATRKLSGASVSPYWPNAIEARRRILVARGALKPRGILDENR